MKSRYEHFYEKAGREQGISPNLIRAIAMHTTQERPDSFFCDRDGCKYGVMFLSLSGAHTVGFREKPDRLFDPRTNISFGALYLRYSLQQHSYNLKKAIVSYLRGRYDSRYTKQAERIIDTWKRLG